MGYAFPRMQPSAGSGTLPAIEELSRVVLSRDLVVDGRRLPAGSAGTVVGVYRKGAAYEVEFSTPFHVVATVEAGAIRR